MGDHAGVLPEVSIIIPVYNTENCLCRCIDSIQMQTFTNFECILVNDGSTDNSPLICDSYANNDKRFSAVHLQNSGVSRARNEGIKRATGKYITFVDSDDWLDQYALEKTLNRIEKHGSDILFFSHYIHYEKNDIVLSKRLFPRDIPLLTKDQKTDIEIKTICDYKGSISKKGILTGYTWGKLIKRNLITDNSVFFDERLPVRQDALFYLNLFECTESISYTTEYLYHYSVRDGSNSHGRYAENIQYYIRFYYAIFDYIGLYNKQKKLLKYIIDNILTFIFIYILQRIKKLGYKIMNGIPIIAEDLSCLLNILYQYRDSLSLSRRFVFLCLYNRPGIFIVLITLAYRIKHIIK